jgi:hypothetical protein
MAPLKPMISRRWWISLLYFQFCYLGCDQFCFFGWIKSIAFCWISVFFVC